MFEGAALNWGWRNGQEEMGLDLGWLPHWELLGGDTPKSKERLQTVGGGGSGLRQEFVGGSASRWHVTPRDWARSPGRESREEEEVGVQPWGGTDSRTVRRLRPGDQGEGAEGGPRPHQTLQLGRGMRTEN